MGRYLVTGSTDGIGLNVAQQLAASGHEVYLHARTPARAEQAKQSVPKAAGVLIGDFASPPSVRAMAAEAKSLGPWDGVVHNAGIGAGTGSGKRDAAGNSELIQINVLAPYALAALMGRPKRLLVLGSAWHSRGDGELKDVAWRDAADIDHIQAYCDSKLQDTILGFALARRWDDVKVAVVEPGHTKTKAGGEAAPLPVDVPGKVIADWVSGEHALSNETGFHMGIKGKSDPHPAVVDAAKQDKLVKTLEDLTGVPLQ